MMGDKFVDRIVEKLLETYKPIHMCKISYTLDPAPYHILMDTLRETYAIDRYGNRSRIRYSLEKSLERKMKKDER